MRIGAVDVGYPDAGGAVAALVLAEDPSFGVLAGERVVRLTDVAPYRPGAFFERELPCLRAVLAGVDLDLLIVDGYVQLDPDGRPGLGVHAAEAFGIPVVGVAKTAFRSATHAVPVLRGDSARPLLVTATGFPVDDAAAMVRGMAGEHRIPDALRRVDQLSRGR
ncbi:deoxyribonuclease V [Allocatelliglobosispora scoriae]|uniref:Deoxyribonuclease V n=1 Tax=Allocatelliglobosispora scoriae TaxID=643052 RepID=A0A841BWZ5_9ACTN|nr:endonuclease V [Allocatelliglobosispora scoriae]MBB5871433.1 deoxyribonuclease V [Allocatelliglobosispora scoriae]